MLYWLFAGIILSEYVQLISDRGTFLGSIMGRSKCDSCDKVIPWYSLLPFIGRFFSGGKCRSCGKVISWKYVYFEVLFSIGWGVLLVTLHYFGMFTFTIAAATLLLYCATALLMYEDYKNYSVPVSWLISWIVLFVAGWWVIGAGKIYYLDTLIMLGVLGLSIAVVYIRKPKHDRSLSSLFGAADLLVLVLFALLLGFNKTTWVLIFSLIGAITFLLFQKRLKEGQRLPLLTVMLPWGIIALYLL